MASKTLLVAQREYLENVRTKTFWLGILAFPAIFAVAIGIGWLMQKTKAARTYAVLDYTESHIADEVERAARAGDFAYSIRRMLRQVNKDPDSVPMLRSLDEIEVTPEQREQAMQLIPESQRAAFESLLSSTAKRYVKVSLEELGVAGRPRDEQERQLGRMVDEGRLFAYFRFEGDLLQRYGDNLVYVSDNRTDTDLPEWYADATTRVVRKARIAAADIRPEVASSIQESAHFKTMKYDAESGTTTDVGDEEVANKWAPVAFVYLLWIAVFTAAQMLLTNTVEEKSNRIIEVLLSSVSPGQLMSGKIWGIGATGLTIVLSWAVFGIVGVALGAKLVPKFGELQLMTIVGDPLYLASFVAYFLTGYLLFAAILVAIGSVCNSLKEAQNLLQPVFLLLMIPLFAMIPVVQEPNGLMARVFTYVPIYTPFAMMNRASGPPPAWEYALTSVLILVSLVVAFKAAGKIFRVGVLMTGNPPKLKEILGWLRE